MSGDISIPVRLACYPEHDAAVAPAVEPDDATQTRDNPHSLFGPPEQASNVLAAMELRAGAIAAPAVPTSRSTLSAPSTER